MTQTTTTPVCEPGTVVLVPFDFSNRRGVKERPAVVISSDDYHRVTADVVLLALTSQTNVQGPRDYSLRDWQGAGLVKPTKTKPQLGSFARGLLSGRIGKLTARDWRNVQASVRSILEL